MNPLLIIVALGAAAAASSSSKRKTVNSEPITSGTAMLKMGKTYRIELSIQGGIVDQPARRTEVAQGLDNGLRMAGAYDVYVSPTIPALCSYSLVAQGDTPVVLGVPAHQQIGGVDAQYTFVKIQEIAPRA